MKILAVCQSGLGSSFMVQMNVQQILKDENVDVDANDITVDHSDVGSATADSADYFFVESTLADALGSIPKERIVLLKSLIDKKETAEHVNYVLDNENITHD
ncbi:MAG: PTS sugar transporter subunit IIB [Furfurilactobacillus sp.]|jgi:PTS system ascorbate-specific IIB component|uniref:PTS sugar transporter subunit IIB n=1 Tax=Furfurilactobacillus TaxID=2767882 RepID=UPI0025869135|nr:PTS sugar transporter subunit IIB [Furfurilactobacillus sp.]MCH4011917.1 PTS sugar transporter subunit IIB [Furfurilactobacillus sp.]MCH4037809.1 PTS sugar transporter subunit IIB [Furfurilactobacillus sp.]MCH4115555.1 PTS sugar transporter subunit IIB [Furfurilactobacillus sp.]MCI1341462.1 PTS sugar transporter subunit IIB [Furfurilactobacillus sp.]MCI1388198.1 PTS sugar transporter subunit IIB [Furfurilactobacillus sp.]